MSRAFIGRRRRRLRGRSSSGASVTSSPRRIRTASDRRRRGAPRATRSLTRGATIGQPAWVSAARKRTRAGPGAGGLFVAEPGSHDMEPATFQYVHTRLHKRTVQCSMAWPGICLRRAKQLCIHQQGIMTALAASTVCTAEACSIVASALA